MTQLDIVPGFLPSTIQTCDSTDSFFLFTSWAYHIYIGFYFTFRAIAVGHFSLWWHRLDFKWSLIKLMMPSGVLWSIKLERCGRANFLQRNTDKPGDLCMSTAYHMFLSACPRWSAAPTMPTQAYSFTKRQQHVTCGSRELRWLW